MIKRALFWTPQRAKLLAYKSLCMPPLQQRIKQQRLQLLMIILSREDTHPVLIESYDELMRRTDNFIQARAQYHGHHTCTTTTFYQKPYESSGKAIKHCSVVQCRVATQHMTGYIHLYWPLSIDKLRIQLPETRTKKLFSLAQMRHAPYTPR